MDYMKEAKLLLSRRGQATLEYVLVLMVVVAIIFGALFQFSEGFGKWGDDYFGDEGYLACLMQTGELPALGGDGQSGLCLEPEMDFAAGGNSGGPGGGSPGSGGGSGSGSDGSKGEKKSKAPLAKNGESGSEGESGSAGGGSGNADGSGSSGARGSFSGRRNSRVRRTTGAAPGEDKLYTGSSEVSTPRGVFKVDGGSGGGFVRAEGIGGYGSTEEERTESKMLTTPMDKESRTVVQKRLRTKIERRPAEAVEADVSLSLGDYLRYFVIAGFIVALLLFLGGQALQISKSME